MYDKVFVVHVVFDIKNTNFLNWRGLWSSGSLWIIRSRTWRYILRKYLVHYRKLKGNRPISLSLGSCDSVLTIYGVVSEGSEEMDYMSLLNFYIYHCKVMGIEWSGSWFLIDLCCFIKLFMWESRDGRLGVVPRESWSLKGVIPFYSSRLTRRAVIGGVFLTLCPCFLCLSLRLFQVILFELFLWFSRVDLRTFV